ncbi:tachylectin-related carbohydrate-binding protein [Amycolatopsis sp. WGS_07]|uniref:tachylectin-related carbohydrate-binding protein n=1 Tax=Amycolatopsis sp. WGS_07 TaxID=3076764 RepID=UPI0038736E47
MRYQLPALGAAAGMVLSGNPGLAAAETAGQSPAIEDYAYPGADKILAEQGIRLKTGNGNIQLVVCGDRTDVIRVVSNRDNARETFCFESRGPKGYLSLEIPATFLAKGDGNAVEMTLTNKGKSQTVPIGKDTWTKLGESADPDNGPATLVEIKTTGAVAAGTGPVDAAPYTAKIDIGQAGVDGRACSGVLIAAQWVATAARCFADDPSQGFAIPAGPPKQKTTATIGRPDLTQTDRGAVVDVVTLVPHPDRDLVLAKLSAPVNGVTPVALSTTAPVAGETLKVTGYGRTADTWVPTKAHTASFTAGTTTDTSVEITGAVGPCKGDAGGPVVRERDGNAELVGLTNTSTQNGCLTEAQTTPGATQARIDNVGGWIRQNVPDLAIVCKPAAPIFTTRADGTLWLYQHTDPRNGSYAWVNGNGRQIGSGWQTGRAVAAPDGLVYQANSNGELRRFRWNGNGWDLNSSSTPYYEVIDHGWDRYAGDEYRNRITADSRGHIYTVEPDGNLHWRSYDPATKKWNHRILKDGWGKYDLIAAAGDGVLYARASSNGDLFRFVYDSATGEWPQVAKPSGTGWKTFKNISSPGADVLYSPYAADSGGLLWYRYLPASDTWVDTGRANGKLIGQGWYTLPGITASPDSCRLAG